MLGLYVANAEEHGVDCRRLRGTTQNDMVKEYLSRGTYIFPPRPSRRLIVDMFAYCNTNVPLWNPMNVCSYHLQEAGATPVQEIAYSLATAIGVLDAVRDSGQVPDDRMPEVVASVSFFVNAGIRFVEETARCGPSTAMWDRHHRRALRRHRSEGPPLPLRRAGQLARPHRGAAREQRPAHRARGARRHAVKARPGPFHPAPGLERGARPPPAVGSAVVAAHPAGARLRDRPARVPGPLRGQSRHRTGSPPTFEAAAQAELDDVLALGGAFEAIDELKGRLVRSHTERMRRIESGDLEVVGVNVFTETAPSPLGGEDDILKVDPAVQDEMISDVQAWRADARPVGVSTRRSTSWTRGTASGEHHAGDDRPREGRWHHRRVVRPTAFGVRGVSRSDRRLRRRRDRRRLRGPRPSRRTTSAPRRVDLPDCWWPSPASTVIPTAPSRSRSPPATPEWR